MCDMISEDFRKLLCNPSLDDETNSNTLFLNTSNTHLLIGPPASGRTSLLFELAFQYVDRDKNVLFITDRSIERLPRLHAKRHTQPTMMQLKRVKIFYTATADEFCRTCASVHLHKTNYSLIVVDNMDVIFNRSYKDALKDAAKMTARLFDAFDYFKNKSCETMLLVSVSLARQAHVTTYLERNFCNVINMYPHPSGIGHMIRNTSAQDAPDDSSVATGWTIRFENDRFCLDT